MRRTLLHSSQTTYCFWRKRSAKNLIRCLKSASAVGDALGRRGNGAVHASGKLAASARTPQDLRESRGCSLGITGALYRTLRSTNIIENLNSSIAHYTRNVRRWRGGSMLQVSSAILEASKSFRAGCVTYLGCPWLWTLSAGRSNRTSESRSTLLSPGAALAKFNRRWDNPTDICRITRRGI